MLWRIECGECDRLVAKIEDGCVCLVCPRCKTETRIKITALIEDLEQFLRDVIDDYADEPISTRPRGHRSSKPPKPFG